MVQKERKMTDISEKILESRIIFLTGGIDDNANDIVAQLLYLESINDEDIYLYINSPGGWVSAGMAILDAMNQVYPDVATICFGEACSMGAILLACGEPGKRFILPNARVMIHQPSGGTEGVTEDILIDAEEIKKLRSILNKILSERTGLPIKKIEKLVDRDYYMSAKEAKKMGFVDEVLVSYKQSDKRGVKPTEKRKTKKK